MPDWFDKARQTITRGPVRSEPEPFERTCVCGETVGGERRAQAQEVACPRCGREWFVLPLDPYPRPRPRSTKPPLWKRLAPDGATTTAPGTNGRPAANSAFQTAAPPRPKRPALRQQLKERVATTTQAVRERAKRAARPLRLVGVGIVALVLLTGAWLWQRARVEAASAMLVAAVPQAEQAIERRDFFAAERFFAEAASAVDVLGAEDATASRVRQRHRELVACNGLAAQTPYDLAAQAERVGVDPTNWSDQFAAVHGGRWLILDVPLGEPEDATPVSDPEDESDRPSRPAGKVVPLDLPLAVGKFPVRFEMDAEFFGGAKSKGRAIFAAQYDTWRLHRAPEGPATWVVRLRPETAFVWCSPDLYASLGFDLDAEVDSPRAVLAQQAKATGVPVGESEEAGANADEQRRKEGANE